MEVAIIAVIVVVVMALLARRADRRFRREARLPMQWGPTGGVNWSAPRRLALAFMPAMAAVLLGFIAILLLTVPPRAGQEGLVLPVAMAMGLLLIAAQLFHFWLIGRTLRGPRYQGRGAGQRKEGR